MFPKEMKTMQKLIYLSMKTEPNSGIETNLLNAERVEWGWIHQATGEIKKTGCGLLGREAGQRSVPVGLNIGYHFKSQKLGLPLVFFPTVTGFKRHLMNNSTLVVFVKEQFFKKSISHLATSYHL